MSIIGLFVGVFVVIAASLFVPWYFVTAILAAAILAILLAR